MPEFWTFTPGPGGLGFFTPGSTDGTIPRTPHTRSLSLFTTINTCEIAAVEDAVEFVLAQPTRNQPTLVNIHTDSTWAKNICNGNWVPTQAVHLRYLSSIFDRMRPSPMNFDIFWVKAHSGLEGNEIADRCAKIGAQEAAVRCHPPTDTTYTQAKMDIRETVTTRRQHLWHTGTTARRIHQFLPILSSRIHQEHSSLNRIHQIIITHLLL